MWLFTHSLSFSVGNFLLRYCEVSKFLLHARTNLKGSRSGKKEYPTHWSSAHLTSSRAWKSAAPTLQAANMNSSSRRLIHFHMVDRSVFLLSPVLCSGRLKPSEERAGDSDGCSMIDLHYKISFVIFGENIYGRLK